MPKPNVTTRRMGGVFGAITPRAPSRPIVRIASRIGPHASLEPRRGPHPLDLPVHAFAGDKAKPYEVPAGKAPAGKKKKEAGARKRAGKAAPEAANARPAPKAKPVRKRAAITKTIAKGQIGYKVPKKQKKAPEPAVSPAEGTVPVALLAYAKGVLVSEGNRRPTAEEIFRRGEKMQELMGAGEDRDDDSDEDTSSNSGSSRDSFGVAPDDVPPPPAPGAKKAPVIVLLPTKKARVRTPAKMFGDVEAVVPPRSSSGGPVGVSMHKELRQCLSALNLSDSWGECLDFAGFSDPNSILSIGSGTLRDGKPGTDSYERDLLSFFAHLERAGELPTLECEPSRAAYLRDGRDLMGLLRSRIDECHGLRCKAGGFDSATSPASAAPVGGGRSKANRRSTSAPPADRRGRALSEGARALRIADYREAVVQSQLRGSALHISLLPDAMDVMTASDAMFRTPPRMPALSSVQLPVGLSSVTKKTKKRKAHFSHDFSTRDSARQVFIRFLRTVGVAGAVGAGPQFVVNNCDYYSGVPKDLEAAGKACPADGESDAEEDSDEDEDEDNEKILIAKYPAISGFGDAAIACSMEKGLSRKAEVRYFKELIGAIDTSMCASP